MAHSTMDSSTASTMHTTQCPFNELPSEIFHMIFTTIDQLDLINCARSTKSLYKLTESYLWRTVRVETAGQKECFQTAAQQALVRNAKHVRDLYLDKELFPLCLPQTSTSSTLSTSRPSTRSSSSSSLSLVPFLSGEPRSDRFSPALCTRLQRLHLHTAGLTKDTLGTMEDAIASLLRQNESLTNVMLGAFNMSPKTLMRLTSKELSNLQDLQLTSIMRPRMAKLLLEGLPESIQKVVMEVTLDSNEGNETVLPRAGDLALRNHDLLENLTICWKSDEADVDDVLFGAVEESILIPFLDSCSNLKNFGDYTTVMFGNQRIRTAFDRLGIQCTRLDFGALFEISTDQEMAHIIRLSQWQEISFSFFKTVGPQTLAAVLEHAEHLRVLEVTCCNRHFSSQDMCAFLGKCRALVKLDAIDRALPIAVNNMDPNQLLSPAISGADFIQLDWPSAPSLKWWICMITVPRPDIDGDGHDHTINAMEARRIQRQVYQKLAQLTGLCELCLGLLDIGEEDVENSWYQTHSLEMTLESGLDGLAPLKDLEVLDVSYMMHKIGVQELEWMVANWPKLERVKGLFRSCRDPVPGAREWVKKHRPDWEGESSRFERQL